MDMYVTEGWTSSKATGRRENIRRVYGYECERLDIDITSTYFEGSECILARGRLKDLSFTLPSASCPPLCIDTYLHVWRSIRVGDVNWRNG